jgi:hypothetical protein
MSETATAARPLRVTIVSPKGRDFNAVPRFAPPDGTPSPAAADVAAGLSKREAKILAQLRSAIRPDGSADPLSRAELKTSSPFIQDMCYAGLVNGAGTRDARGSGNTPQSSWWWLTRWGEEVACALPAKDAPR